MEVVVHHTGSGQMIKFKFCTYMYRYQFADQGNRDDRQGGGASEGWERGPAALTPIKFLKYKYACFHVYLYLWYVGR